LPDLERRITFPLYLTGEMIPERLNNSNNFNHKRIILKRGKTNWTL